MSGIAIHDYAMAIHVQVEMALQEAEEQLNDGAASPNVVTDFSSRLIESLGKEMGWLGFCGHEAMGGNCRVVGVLDHV